MKSIVFIMSITLAAGFGCGKKGEGGGEGGGDKAGGDKAGGDKAGGDDKQTKPKPSGPFGAWDAAAEAKKFEGDWVCPGGSRGVWHAWEIKGDKVKVWDGTQEKTLEFSVTSPCHISLIENTADGSSGTTPRFTWDENGEMLQMADLGVVKGDVAYACISNKVYRLEGDKCTEMSEMFGKWEEKEADCTLTDAEFELKGERGTKLARKGDALVGSAPLQCDKMGNWDAAKDAQANKK